MKSPPEYQLEGIPLQDIWRMGFDAGWDEATKQFQGEYKVTGTAEECERIMVEKYNSHCANPKEHER